MTVTEAGRALAAGKAAPVSAGRAAQELALRRGTSISPSTWG